MGLHWKGQKKIVTENYRGVIIRLFQERSRQFQSPTELRQFVEGIATDINKGIVKEGVLIREGADSTKFDYTKVANLDVAMEQFYGEFFERLNNPKQDPIELAAWVEYRVNLVDHFFADGCGKTSQAISSFVLMRSDRPLPKFSSKKEITDLSPDDLKKAGVENAKQESLPRLTALFRRLMTPH